MGFEQFTKKQPKPKGDIIQIAGTCPVCDEQVSTGSIITEDDLKYVEWVCSSGHSTRMKWTL